MEVTEKKGCVFAVWTGKNYSLKVEYIRRDKKFWSEKMFNQLHSFYHDCMLPELVDPRFGRNMPIRDPSSVIAAQEELKKKGKKR